MSKAIKASPTAWEDFYLEYDERFRSICERANWTGSGDDAEDLLQWLWMHFWEVWEAKDVASWTEKTVLTHASREAKGHAKDERISYEEFRCEYIYTTQMVKMYLQEVVWSPLEHCIDIDARVDIQQAFSSLTAIRQDAIYRYYELDERFPQGSAGERAFARGIKDLTYRLNAGLPKTTMSLDDADEFALEDRDEGAFA